MIKKDPRFTELLEKFETESRIKKFMSIVDDINSVDNIDRILNYIDKHCEGKLSILTREHQKSRHKK